MTAPTARQNIKPKPLSADTLRQEFIAFLKGSRSAKLYSFLYRDEIMEIPLANHSGMDGWDKALKQDNKYYIYRNEVELIVRSAEALANLPYCPVLIELGIGSQKAVISKSLPILHALEPQHFVINDISSDAVASAAEAIKNELPGLSVKLIAADFLDPQSELYEISDANVVISGSTISNITAYNGQLPVNEVVAYLKTLSKLIGSKGTLIITQDTNQDETSLKAAYSEPDLVKFRLDMLYRLNEFLGVTGFDLSALKYEPVWEPSCHLLANTFINTADQHIKIGRETIAIPAGQRLYVSNCYKYPSVDFLHMAKMAGLSPVWSHPDRQGRIVFHALCHS